MAQEAGNDHMAWWLTVQAVRMAEDLGQPAEAAELLETRVAEFDLRRLSKVLSRWRSHPPVGALLPTLTALLQESPTRWSGRC